MKKIYLSALLLAPLLGQAQDLDQNVTATAGAYSENATGSLSWTIGETVIETVTDGSTTLAQGFHQGNLSVTTLITEQEIANSFKVYPNPVENILNIESDETGLDYQLLNINGQEVGKGIIESHSETIDFSDFPTGTFILKINNKETHKIVKH